MRLGSVVLCVSLFLVPALATGGQGQPASPPADGASVDSLVAALYDVISGPAGHARDWDQFRALFAPGARLIPATPRQDGSAPLALSLDDYVARTSEAFLKNGLFERQVASGTEAFGTIVHVFSTYESRRARDDAKPFARGINSIQVAKFRGRWWIVTVMWDQQRADNPLPAKYLPGGAPGM